MEVATAKTTGLRRQDPEEWMEERARQRNGGYAHTRDSAPRQLTPMLGIIVASEFTDLLRFAAKAMSGVALKRYEVRFAFIDL
jgi:hypothetical protein